MLGTRETRGNLAVTRAMDDHSTEFSLILLNLDAFSLPLGWQLSKVSQLIVGEHSGYPERRINFDSDVDQMLANLLTNDYEACRVQAFLDIQYSKERSTERCWP
jgi:hypothetical protein